MSSGLLSSIFVFSQVSICERYNTGRSSSVGCVSAPGIDSTARSVYYYVENRFPLPLIQAEQVAVTGEIIDT